ALDAADQSRRHAGPARERLSRGELRVAQHPQCRSRGREGREMRPTITRAIHASGIVAVLVVFAPAATLCAQSVAGSSGSWRVPRTAGGHPDLEGVWNASTL